MGTCPCRPVSTLSAARHFAFGTAASESAAVTTPIDTHSNATAIEPLIRTSTPASPSSYEERDHTVTSRRVKKVSNLGRLDGRVAPTYSPMTTVTLSVIGGERGLGRGSSGMRRTLRIVA